MVTPEYRTQSYKESREKQQGNQKLFLKFHVQKLHLCSEMNFPVFSATLIRMCLYSDYGNGMPLLSMQVNVC